MSDIGAAKDEDGIAGGNDPLALFTAWMNDAKKSEPALPDAMSLATVDASGCPNVRMVLLKDWDADGFVFYSNNESVKGGELAANPRAALCLHWKSLKREVRVRGMVSEVSTEEADAYFASRPRDSQIGAWASAQSRPLESRFHFEKEIARYAAKYALGPVPRPAYWIGYRITPVEIEFWRDRPFRLHDRLLYRPRRQQRAVDDAEAVSVSLVSDSLLEDTHGRHMRRAAKASLAVSLFLVAIKSYAYFASDSVAMLASLADSALDLFTAALNLFAIHEALAPADREHRFGHGKAEPLAGLAQGAFICASAVFLVIEAVQRLLAPQPIDHSLQAMIVMCISIFAAICLILYQRAVVARTGSLAVSADAVHYFGDLVSNIGVVAAILLVSLLGWLRADPLIALFVALVLVVSAWSVFRQSLDQLMDRELPDDERERIKAIVRGHDDVAALHELKTRKAGLTTFIQVHIELDPQLSLAQAHQISDAVEKAVCTEFPNAEVMIHQDPAGHEMSQDRADTV